MSDSTLPQPSKNSKPLHPRQLNHLPGRPIAYYPAIAEAVGGVNPAVLLSQLVYWTPRAKDSTGWIYKSQLELMQETGLSRHEQRSARASLKRRGLLDERYDRLDHRLYVRIDAAAYNALVSRVEGKLEAGTLPDETLEEFLEAERAKLRALSRAGYRRAQTLGIIAEHVNYAEVLMRDGLSCGLCQGAIRREIGQTADCLAFDHVIPLDAGGAHTYLNVQPSHVYCNVRKGNRS